MSVYRVWAQSISDVFIDIEAESADKARELAEDIDGGDFHDDGFGDWRFGSVAEMEDDVEPDYTQAELEGEGERIVATCSFCGKQESYFLNAEETATLRKYRIYGRELGYIQDLFPKVPAWIRSGAIDQFSGGFCICPNCCG